MLGAVVAVSLGILGAGLLAIAALKGRLRRVLQGHPHDGALASAMRRAEPGSWWTRRFNREDDS
jgi:hypothetical protein